MKRKYFLLAFLFLGFTTLYSTEFSPKEIFQINRPKICLISYYQNISSNTRIGSYNKIKRYRTGIIVSANGLIMVSSDVYPVSLDILSGESQSLLSAKPTDFKVKLANGKEFPAKFLGKDDHTIAAVVKSDQRKLLVYNYTPALSAGGLVLDTAGHAIGVTLKQTIDFSFRPPDEFEDFHKDFLEILPAEQFLKLIENPPVQAEPQLAKRAWLGISMQALTRELAAYWQISQGGGVVIDQVYPQSPAEAAGLQVGDVILAVNDSVMNIQKDEETAKLRTLIRSLPPGSIAKMKIFRQGKFLQKTVRLTAAPKAIGLAQKYQVPQLGFEIRELTRDILYQENLPLSTPGVFVFQVDRASPAGLAGLSIGSLIQRINEQPVKNLAAAQKIIEQELNDKTQKIMLQVLEHRSTRFVFIDLKK
ncbi:hypothetical protein B1H10_01455 [candidate division KSB1 bacterium 4484_188]|nr:MAG: hypothetical protein B1H10_01455 [candidate division KSB1 bacterium 4484_188]